MFSLPKTFICAILIIVILMGVTIAFAFKAPGKVVLLPLAVKSISKDEDNDPLTFYFSLETRRNNQYVTIREKIIEGTPEEEEGFYSAEWVINDLLPGWYRAFSWASDGEEISPVGWISWYIRWHLVVYIVEDEEGGLTAYHYRVNDDKAVGQPD